MSISIDELSSIYGMYGVNGITQNNSQAVTDTDAEKKTTDGDSYISTISGMDLNAAIPSENYNDLGRKLKTASQTTASADSTEYTSVTGTSTSDDESQSTAAAQGASSGGSAGGASGGDDSDSDEDTETEIVTINGQTYLQTTTTDSSGNTTVTRVPVGVSPVNNDGSQTSYGPSAAAEALSSSLTTP